MASYICPCCFNKDKDPELEAINQRGQSEKHIPSGGSITDISAKNYSVWGRLKNVSKLFSQNSTKNSAEDPSKHGFVNPSPKFRQDSTQSADIQSLQSSRSPGSSPMKDSGLWKDVQKFTTNFINDVSQSGNSLADDLISSEDAEGVDYKLGRLHYSIEYDFPSSTMTVKVYRALNLPAKDISGTSDPYVRVILLPDKKYKFMTKIKKRNLNPKWNEAFAYEGWPHNKLLEKTLYLQVVDYDRFSKDDPIGEVYVPLNEIDMTLSLSKWANLQPCKDSRGKLGELLLSLCYQPTGRLTLIPIEARDLKAKDFLGLSDPYVKIWFSLSSKRIEKKKTAVHYGTLNPVFNETFIFDIPWEKIRETSLEISVMDFDKIGRNELIGKFTLGSRCGPNETKHWNNMISNPKQPVIQWHTLKD